MGERTSFTPGTFCWADLGTADTDAAAAFYGALFGWEGAPGEP
jgi:predicted enzyme related to lactoylglutathione lyase